MKFIVFVKATPESENGAPPSAELLNQMMKYNEELVKAGILLDGGGLLPSASGKRVKFEGKSRQVIDGPFTESKELVAGYWLWQCRSMEEALEWAKRCPNPTNESGVLEIRPLFEMADFPNADTETVERAKRLENQLKV